MDSSTLYGCGAALIFIGMAGLVILIAMIVFFFTTGAIVIN